MALESKQVPDLTRRSELSSAAWSELWKDPFVPLQVLGSEGIIQHFTLQEMPCAGSLFLLWGLWHDRHSGRTLPLALAPRISLLVSKAALLKGVGFKLVVEGLNNHPGSSASYLWFLEGNLGAGNNP